MSCIGGKENKVTRQDLLDAEEAGVGREFSNVFVGDAGISNIRELITDPVLVTDKTDEAVDLLLKRSQYRYKGKMGLKDPIEEVIEENKITRIEEDNEYKRIYIHKLNMIPTGEQDEQGNYIYNVTAVFTLIDNPVWLVPALWSLTAIGGTVGGWFLVDKFEEFTSTSTGSLVTIGATVIGLFLTWKALSQ